MAEFTGKVALVTGGGIGIGKATALAFAEKGAKVAVSVNSSVKAGEAVVKQIQQQGGDAFLIQANVTKEDDIKQMVNAVVKQYGRLDFAFNNAGFEGKQDLLADGTAENFEKVININLFGTWACMKYEILQMLEQGSGSIVNMSSVSGLVGFPFVPAYTASKHGINGLTKSAALGYAQSGIRVNAIAGGGVNTEMVDRLSFGRQPEIMEQFNALHPMGRIAEPEEVASVAVWLCSEGSAFVTGHVVAVDGGLTAQ